MEKQSDVTCVQPLWHNIVDLSFIGLEVEDGDVAGVTFGGGEEDPRPLETAPRVLLPYDGRFRHWSSSGRCTATRLKQDKTYNVNLKWDPNIICNR